MATMDVVVVFQRQEYYVSTQASVDRSTLAVDLLQCQLLSLVGVLPDEQVLLSPTGEVLYSPSKADVATIAVSSGGRPRFFLLSSAESSPKEMAGDWTQICTKSTFGGAAMVQPAFRKVASGGGDPLKTLICGPCARTCTTGFQPVSPMEWGASKMLASRFISEIAVVAGDVDVAAPSGFTKLPGDLNYSASGDYVYLCVKRGGPRALTQLHVLFDQIGEGSSNADASVGMNVNAPEKVVDVDCNSGGAAGDGSGMSVRIGCDSVQLGGNMKQLDTLVITDILVVVGDEPTPSSAYVKIPRNLNEGTPGAQPIFLCYRLAPIGGFVCDSGLEHSEFGECLFATRHLAGVESLLDLDEPQLGFARTTLAAARRQGDDAIMEAHYRQHQSGMLGRLQSGLQRAQSYENKQMQEEALRRIPVDKLHERARANSSPMPSYQDELVKQLLHWFKREFFTWMNQPRCSSCNHDKTRSVRTEGPSTPEEMAGQASRVEVYQCPACGALTRFPRYNNPVTLLDTRTGRCGEWANCFTLCCRAMGFEARYVLDVADHVWTEVYSEYFKRWLHCDSCEDQLDCPLTYEVGWGKKLSYIFSFGQDEVVDTARRYTQNWPEMRSRRQDVSEMWLETTISNMNRGLRDRLTPERVAILTARAKSELEELLRGKSVQKTEIKGRVSGSAEWKSERNEDGKHEEKSTSTTSTSSPKKTVNTVPASEILQTICKNLVVGCQSTECSNPFCFTGRTSLNFSGPSSDVNERAAQALQLVTSLSTKGFSASSLAMLECSTQKGIRCFMWKNQPLVYLPLQDPRSTTERATLIDISGHDNHVENAERCALHKPFHIPNSTAEDQPETSDFGVQLLRGKRLPIAVRKGLPSSGFTLSFLVRFDQDESFKVESTGAINVLACQLNASDSDISVHFRIRWNCTEQRFFCELQHGDKSLADTSSALTFGQYAHIAIARDETKLTMYVNGTKTTEAEVESFKVDEVTLEGPARDCSNAAAVISQVAIIPAKSHEEIVAFCAAMKNNFVAAPPLRAFGLDGERDDKRCDEAAAGAQSGYHVAQVLMWGGEFFDGLQFVYEKALATEDTPSMSSTAVYGSLMGNGHAKRQASKPTATLDLLPDEFITRVSGRKGAWTDSITLHTNFGRSVTCGGRGGGDFSISTPAESEIRLISFKVGDHLTDTVVFVMDPSPAKDLEGDTREALSKTMSSIEPPLRQNAISAALRYLENIARRPEEVKFQRIRASNKFFASNVGALGDAAVKSFMHWCGFEETSEQGDQFFIFQPSQLQDKPSPQRVAAEAHKRVHFLKKFGA